MTRANTVADLLAERAKYTAWLDQLEARTAGAPTHVVAKVRDDYSRRLSAVREALGARADELAAQRTAALERRDAAQAAEHEVSDARAEAELRHAVGEYSADEWAALARESDAALATATANRLAAEVALADVERALRDVQAPIEPVFEAKPEVLADAAPPPPPPPAPEPVPVVGHADAEPLAEPAPELAPTPVLAETEPSVPVVEDEPDAPPTVTTTVERPAMPAPALDDLFLAPIGDEPLADAPPAARSSGAIRGTEAFNDLEFLKTLRTSGASSAVPASPAMPPAPLPPPVIPPAPPPPRISREFAPPPEPIPPDPTVSSPEAQLFAPRRTDPGVDAVRAAAFTPSALRPSGSGTAAKSLKCAECGAMNYPTEWYCERCGGELASM